MLLSDSSHKIYTWYEGIICDLIFMHNACAIIGSNWLNNWQKINC